MKKILAAIFLGRPFTMTGRDHDGGDRTSCGLNIHAPSKPREEQK